MERMWRKMNQGLISRPSASGKIRGSGVNASPSTVHLVDPAAGAVGGIAGVGGLSMPPSTSESYLLRMRNPTNSATSTESRRKRRRKSKPRCNKNNRYFNFNF